MSGYWGDKPSWSEGKRPSQWHWTNPFNVPGLTPRGEMVIAALMLLGAFLLIWALVALGSWWTGVYE